MYHADVEQQACFNVEVRVPYELAAAFADAMTGFDDDILLAAELAMRKRLGSMGADENVELAGWSDDTVREFLRDAAAKVRA